MVFLLQGKENKENKIRKANKEKINKFLRVALNELNIPYYFLTSEVASKLKIKEPKIDELVKKLRNKVKISRKTTLFGKNITP